MPLYLYRCDAGHESEHLGHYDDRTEPHPCLTCGEPAAYVLSPHHTQPDGLYSYEPNLGDPKAFERKHEEAKERQRRVS